ncbi:MAG: hypothetical protein D6706_01265 [Chloroflexi bacterium]|nr:MAG: hypothetical protein D6706_01265 [Chloroflexota bacterium]
MSDNGLEKDLTEAGVVRVSENDTTSKPISTALQAGSNVTLTVINSGGDEALEIAATAGAGSDTVKVSASDTTAGTLDTKIVAGSGVTLSILNPAGNEQYQINVQQDASDVTFTASDVGNWTGGVSPAAVDGALDQLALRVTGVEGGTGATGFLQNNTVIATNETLTANHQVNYVGEISFSTGASIDFGANSELNILSYDINAAVEILYSPSVSGDWNGAVAEAASALDELASRVKTVEQGVSGGVYQTWDVDAPPTSAGSLDDEFNDGTFSGWSLYDFASQMSTPTEGNFGLTLIKNTTASSEPIWSGIYKALPAGDFTITTKIMANDITENGTYAGLALFEDAASATGDLVFYGLLGGVGGYIVERHYTQYNPASNTQTAFHDYDARTVYLRVRRAGTTYYFSHSVDGMSWVNHPQSTTLSYVPQHVGIVFDNILSITGWTIRVGHFRYKNSDVGYYEPIAGRLVTI